MNKYKLKIFFFSVLIHFSLSVFGSQEMAGARVKAVYLGTPAPLKKEKKVPLSQRIWFKFVDQPLFEIVNYVANAMKLNVVLPQGTEALTVKVTIQFPDKISPQKAYDELLSILKINGYSVVPQNDFHYIIKNDKSLNSQPLPLYIHTLPADIPDQDQIIRYIYYFANIQVPTGASSGYGSSSNALQMLLQDTLSKAATLIFDSSINGMVITDYARTIKSVMEVVIQLDTYGFTDSIEIIPLKKTDAGTVTTLFKTLIAPTDPQTGQAGALQTSPQAPLSSVNYFSQTTRIVPIMRSNSVVVMGKKEAIKRISEFIQKYVDVELDNGESVLHIYPLQYLKAQSFAPVLTQIVASQAGSSSVGAGLYGGTSSQSSGSTNPMPGQQFFKGVVIVPEIISTVNAPSAVATTGSSASAPQPAQQGGNRLLVAATQEDWIHLKKLIEELDRPQPQVAIEVLIVDLTLNNARTLGSQIRNKQNMLPPGVNFQNSTLGPIQLSGGNNPGFDALMANLLQLDNAGNGTNLATQMTGGSFVLSLDNPSTGVSWLLQVLNGYTNTKVLSHPFAVVLNNQLTTFQDVETRILPGNATVKKGATFAPLTPIPAALNVTLTPLINGDNFVNLSLTININAFITGSSNAQNTRQIITNANVKSGQILVLGGLTQTNTTVVDLGTPILQDIPLIGWLFKSKNKSVIKSNLAVFICPRILEGTDGYCDSFTADKFLKVSAVVDPAQSKNLAGLRDPITRWFFGSQHSSANQEKVMNFTEQKMYQDDKDYKSIIETDDIKIAQAQSAPKTQVSSRSITDALEEKKQPIMIAASKNKEALEPTFGQSKEAQDAFNEERELKALSKMLQNPSAVAHSAMA